MSCDELQGILSKIHIPCSANSVLYDAQYRINILYDHVNIQNYMNENEIENAKRRLIRREKHKRLRRSAFSEKSGNKTNDSLCLNTGNYLFYSQTLSAKENE